MGVDIHGIVQIYKWGRWKTVKEIPTAFENGFRNSNWFQFLKEECRYGFPPEARGSWFLEEYCGEKYYRAEFGTNKDFYGDGWMTLQDFNDNVAKLNRQLSVPEEWWDVFISLGGELPEGMCVCDDCSDDKRVYFTIEDQDEYNDISYWLIDSRFSLYKIMKKYRAKDVRVVFNFDC